MTSIHGIPTSTDQRDAWSPDRSRAHYAIDRWGAGYFDVDDRGRMTVRTSADGTRPEHAIVIEDVVRELRARGFATPVLLRFPDVLTHRVQTLVGAFDRAREQDAYAGGYTCLFPIKVNQARQVVERVIEEAVRAHEEGGSARVGLEAGSKPELWAVLGLAAAHPEVEIVCNGFKDAEYLETALLASRLGRRVTVVVESTDELRALVEIAAQLGVAPRIGLRARLTSAGAGRWQESLGERSKFGLTATQMLAAVEFLRERDALGSLRLLHFHAGSQVCDVRALKQTVSELAYVYSDLCALGAPLEDLDVGGGLAVDYDGSRSAGESSMNYTIDEYAADVVDRIKAVCDQRGIAHPRILTECGRAIAAYSSVLVFDVRGVTTPGAESVKIPEITDPPPPLVVLRETLERVESMDPLEALHDATDARGALHAIASMGYASLVARASGERTFAQIGRRLLRRAHEAGTRSSDFDELARLLADQVLVNVSVFQSLPDSWAIEQLFPICPVHRLGERPTRRGVLHDLTCDSDGKIDRFVEPDNPDGTRVRTMIDLHEPRAGEAYLLGAFLVGAYQEILGDYHNLFGDQHVAHVRRGADGSLVIEDIVPGDTVNEVLGYVHTDAEALRWRVRAACERAIADGLIDRAQARSMLAHYESGLEGYTYLES
ncbi:MAG: biosynthetic arginine decarboxylase [Planctomycetota bacterium]